MGEWVGGVLNDNLCGFLGNWFLFFLSWVRGWGGGVFVWSRDGESGKLPCPRALLLKPPPPPLFKINTDTTSISESLMASLVKTGDSLSTCECVVGVVVIVCSGKCVV